jgi:hypothetical protein
MAELDAATECEVDLHAAAQEEELRGFMNFLSCEPTSPNRQLFPSENLSMQP